MEFKDEDIKEFIRLWEEEFGEKLSSEEARLKTDLLIDFWYQISQPLSEDSNGSREEPS